MTARGCDLVLADAYLDWFALCARERSGDVPTAAECRAALSAVRVAERLCAHTTFVYEITKGKHWTETGEEP